MKRHNDVIFSKIVWRRPLIGWQRTVSVQDSCAHSRKNEFLKTIHTKYYIPVQEKKPIYYCLLPTIQLLHINNDFIATFRGHRTNMYNYRGVSTNGGCSGRP